MTKDRLFSNRKHNVLTKIQAVPGISGATLCRKTHSIPVPARQRILAELEVEGKIEVKVVPTSGRTGLRYYPIANQTQQEASGSTQPANGLVGRTEALPSASERQALIQRLRDADPRRVDWNRLRAVAYAAQQ